MTILPKCLASGLGSAALVLLLWPLDSQAAVARHMPANSLFPMQTVHYYFDPHIDEVTGDPWERKLTEGTHKWTYADPASLWGTLTIREAFVEGMEMLREANPGLKFVEIDPAEARSYPMAIKIIKQTEARVTCYARSINEDGGRRRVIAINKYCHAGISAHEMLHLLGFRHGQQSPDRDTYACVFIGGTYLEGTANEFTLPENIGRGHGNFRLANNARLFGKYDFDSIMHYSDSIMQKDASESSTYPRVTLGKRLAPGPLTGKDDCMPGTGIHYWEEEDGNGRSYHGQRSGLSPIDRWALREMFYHSYRPETGADFNGDGLADLAVRIRSSEREHAVVIAYGGSYASDTPGINRNNVPAASRLLRPLVAGGNEFAASLTFGDFNGDYRMDLAVAEPSDNAVHLYLGALDNPDSKGEIGLLADQRIVLRGEAGFGGALAGADFNGDGFGDLAVGATNSGTVQIFMGSASGLEESTTLRRELIQAQVASNAQNNHFGSALAVGDFNGDGRADLAVGVPAADIEGQASAGAVAIFAGTGAGIDDTPTLLWRGLGKLPGRPGYGNRFGETLAVGDFDNDGVQDLAIAAPAAAVSRDGVPVDATGYITVVYGSRGTGLVADSTRVVGLAQSDFGRTNTTGDQFGQAMVSADFSGDGYSDLAVAAPGRPEANGVGRVYIIDGDRDGLHPARARSMTVDSLCSRCASTAPRIALSNGDFDGNGYVDLVVAIDGSDEARVAIVYNGSAYATESTSQRRTFPAVETYSGDDLAGSMHQRENWQTTSVLH